MKRKNSIMVIVLLCLVSLLFTAGCGGSSEKSPYEGKWVAVAAQMMGMSIGVEDCLGGAFEFEAKSGGKASVSIGEETGSGKWSVEEKEFTLTIEGEDMVGVLGENTISFDNMLGMGAKIIFAKEGTDAMNPELYLTDEERAVLGEWMSESVEELLGDGPKTSMEGVEDTKEGTDAMNPELYLTDEERAVLGEWMSESVEELLGDGPKTSMEGVEDIYDALRLNFKNDRSVEVFYKGQDIGTFPWSVALGYCTIDTEEPSLSVTINEDGTLDVDYSDEEDYYTFHCIKNSTESK